MEQKKRTKKIYDSKVFWMIISLLCSLMMWAYVTSQDTTDKNLTFTGIPVEFQGQEELLSERNLSITDVSADSVSIVVKGNRSTISKLKASDIKAVIDVSSITAPNNMTWTYKLIFPNYVNEKTQILSISPLLKTAAKRSILRAALKGPLPRAA